ncbi:hypothetical protein ACC757_23735 [Rhizobium ruizarguesonis]
MSEEGQNFDPLTHLDRSLEYDFQRKQLVREIHSERVRSKHYLSLSGFKKQTPETLVIFEKWDERVRAAMTITPSVLAELTKTLEESFADRTLSMWEGKVQRAAFGDQFGFPKFFDEKYPEIGKLLQAWDAKVAAENYEPDHRAIFLKKQAAQRESSEPPKWSYFAARKNPNREGTFQIEARLKAVLDADLRKDAIVISRRGKIHREHYAGVLGVNPGALSTYIKVFKYYENHLGGLKEKFADQIDEMDAWFAKKLARGQLAVRFGQVERQPFFDHFGIGAYNLQQAPLIRKLFEKYDGLVPQSSYRTSSEADVGGKLSDLLAASPQLNEDGLTINRKLLATMLGIWTSRLNRSPFIEMVRAKEKVVRAQAESDPLQTIIGKRSYNFADLVTAGWGFDKAGAICLMFADRYSRRRTVEVNQLRRELRFVCEVLSRGESASTRDAFAAINGSRELPSEVWGRAKDQLSRALREGGKSEGTEQNRKHIINMLLKDLGDANIFPHGKGISLQKRNAPVAHRKSFAETFRPEAADEIPSPIPGLSAPFLVTDEKEEDAQEDERIAFARWALLRTSTSVGASASAEAETFIRVLQKEMQQRPGELPSDPIQAICDINSRRISLLVESGVERFNKWSAHFERGQVLVENGVDPAEYEAVIFGKSSGIVARSEAYEKYFPHDPERKDEALSNLLRLLRDRYDSFVPVQFGENAKDRFFSKRYAKLGSSEEIQAYLIPHRSLICSVILLYLCESGSNLAVACSLYSDCIEESDEPGFVKISGEKARASGRPIIVNFPDNSDALKGLRWVRDKSGTARFLVSSPKLKNLLFLRRAGGNITDVTGVYFLSWFKDLVEAVPDLAGLGLTPAMIRTTVGLNHSLQNEGDLRRGLAYLQHNPEQTGVYQVRVPTEYLYVKMFKKFTTRLVGILFHSDVLAPAPAKEEPLRRPTGLGGDCLVGGCETMDCWQCQHLAVVAEPNALASWMIWNESLRACQGDWVRDRVERWQTKWLPWLAFTDAVIKAMQDTSAHIGLRRIMKRAIEIKHQITSNPNFSPPRPY